MSKSSAKRFVEQTDKLAKKHKAKVSISVPGEKEVVIADHREDPDTLLNVKSLIKNGVERLEKLKEDIKNLNEMMQSTLLNDEQYRLAAEEVKKLTKERQKQKLRILNIPSNRELYEKLQDAKKEKKELRMSQSEYLRVYKKLSKSTQLTLFDGSVMEIVASYSMVKSIKQ